MASSLVIEDGSIVAGANSYATIVELAAYATLRGITTLPATDAGKDAILVKAKDYIETFRDLFQGSKVNEDQTLQFPRYNVIVDDYIIDSDSIPQILKDAQCELAIAAITTDLQPTLTFTDASPAIKKKVGEIEVTYATPDWGRSRTPNVTKAEAMLAPLLQRTGFLATRV